MSRIESSSTALTLYDGRYVNIDGDTMTGALTIGLNDSVLSLGDSTNSSVYSNIQGTRSYVGYDANGYAVLQGGASKGLRLNVNNATFGVGTAVEIDTAGQFKMAGATSSSTGILLGADANLYRSAANTLKTDDALEIVGTTYSQGNITIGTGSTSVGLSVRASSFNGVTADVYSGTASSYWFLRRTRGSLASPTVVTSGSFLGSFGFRGYADAGMTVQDAARISAYATQTFSTTHGGAIGFYTAANGTLVSNGSSERMTIYHDGNVGIGNTAPTFKLQLAAATTAAGGIGFGTDTNLYRFTTDVLKTDDFLDLTANTTAQPSSGSGLGDKLGLYASSLTGRYGFGIQSNELVVYMPTTAALTLRTANTSGSASTGGSTVAKMGNVGTGSAPGITLGSSGDVNAYRFAADHLATDDKLSSFAGLARTNIIMSPESTNNSVLPYFNNDLAYNRLRGGATRVYYDGVLQAGTDSNTDRLFDATSTAFSISSTGITEVQFEIDMCVSLTYGTKVGIAVNEVWKANTIKVEVYTTATTTWTTLFDGTWTNAESFWTHVGSANAISKLRFTFTGFNATYNIFRVGTIYTLNYASAMGTEFFLTKNGGTMYGNITMADAYNIVTNTTTGTKIGTATTQKIGFWNATPIVQPTTSTTAATLVSGGGTALTDTDTFDGYTLAKVVKALRNAGILA